MQNIHTKTIPVCHMEILLMKCETSGSGRRKKAVAMESAAASTRSITAEEFEFQSRERSLCPSRINYLPSRPIMPSKWSDAEKWILNKQNLQLITFSNKTTTQNRLVGAAVKPSVKTGEFEFGSFRAEPVLAQGNGGIRSAEMRDMGTEMTPIPSQEPSRSPTPVDATTPFRSPVSTPPSSPQRQVEAHKELSEQEMKSKITREIIALGVQLGKMNIVAWANKDERDRNKDEGRRIEYGNRAAAWEEAEKAKHEARFKREEIRIEAVESRQKAKLAARTRQMEVRMEQMKAVGETKMEKRMARARAAAEARKARHHEKTAAQAEYIRRTGRIPSNFFMRCWSG